MDAFYFEVVRIRDDEAPEAASFNQVQKPEQQEESVAITLTPKSVSSLKSQHKGLQASTAPPAPTPQSQPKTKAVLSRY